MCCVVSKGLWDVTRGVDTTLLDGIHSFGVFIMVVE